MIVKHAYIIVGLMFFASIITCCHHHNSYTNVDAVDSLLIVSTSHDDSVGFKHSDNGQCNVKVHVTCEYPEIRDTDSTAVAIQNLYINNVLNVENGKSGKINDAIKELSEMIILRYGESIDEIKYDKSADKSIMNYQTNVDIKSIYNKNGLASFCRHEVTLRDGMETMSAHNYCNFDLDSLKKIEIFDLFKEDDLQDISELLKRELLVTLNVNDEDSLVNLGYFNLDNITVTDNFYFDENGVTWNYAIYEIACYSVGETNITLSYEKLAPYINDKSYLYKYLNRLK